MVLNLLEDDIERSTLDGIAAVMFAFFPGLLTYFCFY